MGEKASSVKAKSPSTPWLTRSMRVTLEVRVRQDLAFRDALLIEAVDQFLASDIDTGKAMLRTYIKATIGFERLAAESGSSSRRLMRMFSSTGNPTASKLFNVLRSVQNSAGVRLAVAANGKPLAAHGRKREGA